MRIRLRDFSKGLVCTPSADKIPDNALIIAKGISRNVRGGMIAQRAGSTELHKGASGSVGLTGIYYWDDVWWYGSSNSIYQGSTCISSGTLDGSRITFLSAAPTAGVIDYLFVCGAATNTIWKVDSAASKTVTNWGISPPPDSLTATTAGTTGEMTTGAGYLYRLTYYNDQTGTRSNPTPSPSTIGFSSNTKLIISCTGAHASTEFVDKLGVHTIASTSSAAVSTATADPWGVDNGVLALDAATDSWIHTADHADWDFSTGPFTIDFWAKIKDSSSGVGTQRWLMGQSSQSGSDPYWWISTYENATNTSLRFFTADVVVDGAHSGHFTTTTWYHFAAIRGWGGDNDNFAVCIDGTAVDTTISAAAIPNVADLLTIGGNLAYSSIMSWEGYMSEIRIVKGQAMWTENFTPSTARYGAAYVGTGADDKAVALTGIAPSTDSQVTHTEIWRTGANRSAFFLVTRIAATDTTYEDQTADEDLGINELPTDNLKPYYWFDDAAFHNASMFWLTRTKAGEKGRVYYSPIGRSEAVQGFINVSEDSEPLQRLVKYGTGLGVFSEDGFYEILGENPYYSRKVPGIPGTVEPFSVAVTPYGIAYEAADGPRLLTGTQAIPIGDDTVDALFQGSSAGGITAFTTGTQATYARDEYLVTSTGSTGFLACNLRNRRWREVGLDTGSIYYASEIDKIAVHHIGTTLSVYELEKEGQLDDNASGIPFQIETKRFHIPSQQSVLVRNVFVDLHCTRTVIFGVQHGLTSTKDFTFAGTAARRTVEIPCNVWSQDFGLRITPTTSTTGDCKVYGIDFDVYMPEEEKE